MIYQEQQKLVSDKKPVIDELTNEAQKLLESRPEGDKSELQQQQYQQLRIASSDLKATYEKVRYLMSNIHWSRLFFAIVFNDII